MRILTLVAPVLGTNAYLLAADDGACVVVDPGGGAAGPIGRAVAEHGLRVVAVLATHGHPDHVWDAAAVAGPAGVPLRVHRGDAAMVADPLRVLGGPAAGPAGSAVGAALAQALRAAGRDPDVFPTVAVLPFGDPVDAPFDDVRTPDGGAAGARTDDVLLDLGGLRLTARHAPGHTPGSTLYLVETDGAQVVLTGDVLFAGSIGRTDFPGGDPSAMARTLDEVVRRLPPTARVLPGHGPASRVDVELASNPYLAHLAG